MKKIIAIQLDKNNGKTTLVTESPAIEEVKATTASGKEVVIGLNFTTKKEVITTQSVGGDEYDPYIGVALLLAYAKFGGKEKFRKFVNENAKDLGTKKKLVNYDKMTLADLRKVASQLKIKNYTNFTKAELLTKVKELTK